MVATNIDFEKFSRRASFFCGSWATDSHEVNLWCSLKQNVKRILNGLKIEKYI